MASLPPIDCLARYPFVVVRVACHQCPSRSGSYRLARLAEKYGAETPLLQVLDRIAADCPWRRGYGMRPAGKYEAKCFAGFPDIERPTPRPPDLPAALMRPRLIQGGKS